MLVYQSKLEEEIRPWVMLIKRRLLRLRVKIFFMVNYNRNVVENKF